MPNTPWHEGDRPPPYRRGRKIGPLTKAVFRTAETGRAVYLREGATWPDTNGLYIRCRVRGLRFHYQVVDGTLVLWAEKEGGGDVD